MDIINEKLILLVVPLIYISNRSRYVKIKMDNAIIYSKELLNNTLWKLEKYNLYFKDKLKRVYNFNCENMEYLYEEIEYIKNDNKFNSDDNMLNSMYHKVFGDYYISVNNLDKAVDSYIDAIEYSKNEDYTNKYEIIYIISSCNTCHINR